MRCILLTAVLAACASGLYAREPRPSIALHYSFEPTVRDDKLVMHVLLEFKGPSIQTDSLVLPSSWGDATHLEKQITHLKNVHHGGRVRITYDLVKDWVVPPPRADHRALLEPEYFEFNTQNALIHPPLESSASVVTHFDWRKLPRHWSVATSFGTGTRQQSFRGRWFEMRNALFAGGDFRIQQRTIAGRPLTVAIRGRWQFTDEQAASQVEKLISMERAFWHDYNFPYYLVTISTFGREGGGAGGGGFTNAFALFIQKTSSFGYDVQSLLTHEIFHAWNPYRMGTVPSSSLSLAWFTEGFTTYYQDVLLLRAGLLSFEQYMGKTNEKIRKYLLSPAKNISNAEIIDRSRTDSTISELPYSRGAITALWLDWHVREGTQEKASLDTVMLDLVHTSRGTNPLLTADRIFRVVSQYTDADTLQQLRDDVERGQTVPVPAAALGSCVTLQRDDIPAFELGFDREALLNQHIVLGLKPGSAAFQAGLREGQQVTGTSIYWNDVSKPVKLTVRTENGSQKIEYYPRGASMGLIPQYHLNAEAATSQSQCGPTISGKFRSP